MAHAEYKQVGLLSRDLLNSKEAAAKDCILLGLTFLFCDTSLWVPVREDRPDSDLSYTSVELLWGDCARKLAECTNLCRLSGMYFKARQGKGRQCRNLVQP